MDVDGAPNAFCCGCPKALLVLEVLLLLPKALFWLPNKEPLLLLAPNPPPVCAPNPVVLPVAALHDLVLAATRGTGSMTPTVLVENVGRLGLQALAVLLAWLAGVGEPLLIGEGTSFGHDSLPNDAMRCDAM